MAVCSFLGEHLYVYDRDIMQRLVDAAENVVQENDTVDFWLCPSIPFFSLYLQTALEIKTRYPQKVSITALLKDQEEYERFKLQRFIPHCMVDRIAMFPHSVSKADNNSLSPVIRWMIQQSTHLISYLYERFYGAENWDLYYAKKLPNLRIIDVTCEETAQLIENEICSMPEREQLIFQKLGEGYTLKEIGKLLNLAGSERVRQIRTRAASRVKRTVANRSFGRDVLKQQKPITCSIFALGAPKSDFSYQSGLSFEHTLEYLKDRFNVTHFKISEEYCNSVFMYILRRFQKRAAKDVRITIVATGDVDFDPNDSLGCDCLESIDTTFSKDDPAADIVHYMMESDFCICNLAASGLLDNIRKYAAQTTGTILLDIGKHQEMADKYPFH